MGLGNAQPPTPWERCMGGLTDMGSRLGTSCSKPSEVPLGANVSLSIK